MRISDWSSDVCSSDLGLNVTHIPYRGVAPALQDLMGGRIDFMCNPISTSIPQVEGGTVKAIALLAPNRSALLPNLATADEQGSSAERRVGKEWVRTCRSRW